MIGTERRVGTAGAELVCTEAGSGDPLVLVHGFTGSREDFFDHVDWLAADWHVLTFDHRGHGASDHAGPYSLAQLVDDLDAVLRAYAFERPVLVGHSMGGVVVQAWAVDHPDRVRGLVLMDTWPGGRLRLDDERRNLVEMSAQIARAQGMDVLHDIRGAYDEQFPKNSAAARVAEARPEIIELNSRRFRAMDPEAYAGLVLEGLNGDVADLTPGVADLDVPIFALAGAEDDMFAPVLDTYRSALDGARVVEITGAGHSPQFEAPDSWRAEVGSFLSSLR